MLPVMQWLAESRYTVLAVSFGRMATRRAKRSDFGWSARHDVSRQSVSAAGVPRTAGLCRGTFDGAAAAIFAAKELGSDVAGYFLEQPYKDLQQRRVVPAAPPPAAHGLLDWPAGAYVSACGFRRRCFSAAWTFRDWQISPYEHIADIPENVPIVLISGSADRHALLDEVTELGERVASHARLVVFEGAAHVALDGTTRSFIGASLFELLDHRAGAAGRRPNTTSPGSRKMGTGSVA